MSGILFLSFDILCDRRSEDLLVLLGSIYGDNGMCGAVLDPTYFPTLGHHASFVLNSPDLDVGYRGFLEYDDDGRIGQADTLHFNSNVIALAGHSGQWVIWAERTWEIGILLTLDHVPEVIRECGLSTLAEALDAYRGPEGWTYPLSIAEIAQLEGGVRENLSEST